MINKVQQIDPLDLRSSVGIGVNLPFTGTAVFNTTYTSKDAIKANLINYFLTNKGERFFNPGFGSDIRTILFENINQGKIERLKLTIEEELRFYFPRVSPSKFEIVGDPDRNTLRVYLKYSLKSTNIEDEVLIDIEQ